MKKNIILIALAFTVFYNYSCSQITGDAKLESTEDTLAYAFGMVVGKDFGKNFSQESINGAALAKGVQDAMNEETILDPTDAQMFLQSYFTKIQEEKTAEAQVENNQFFVENAKKEGVVSLESGIQYEVITMGTGPKPEETSTVKTNYRGTLLDGTEFDASPAGEPVEFPLNRVIKGWTEALQLMPTGSKWKLYIPSDLAYGPRGVPNSPIGPNSALIFEIELLEIVE